MVDFITKLICGILDVLYTLRRIIQQNKTYTSRRKKVQLDI